MSNFTWRNIVTFSKTLVQSYKVLKGTEGFVRRCFRKKVLYKKADLKNLAKNSPKRNYYEVLFSVTSQSATSLKKNPITVVFRWLLKIFFRTVFCVRTLAKQQKKQKYLPEYILEKSSPEKLHKIHPKETVMNSFSS